MPDEWRRPTKWSTPPYRDDRSPIASRWTRVGARRLQPAREHGQLVEAAGRAEFRSKTDRGITRRGSPRPRSPEAAGGSYAARVTLAAPRRRVSGIAGKGFQSP